MDNNQMPVWIALEYCGAYTRYQCSNCKGIRNFQKPKPVCPRCKSKMKEN